MIKIVHVSINTTNYMRDSSRKSSKENRIIVSRQLTIQKQNKFPFEDHILVSVTIVRQYKE